MPREMMRDYIDRRTQEREYAEFLRRKVAVAKAQQATGLHASHEEVEAEAAMRRAELLRNSTP